MRLAICFFAFFLLGTSGTPIQPVEILSGVWGSFSSPNYPRVYNNNLRKEWTIRVREGHHIMLEFTSFNLEDSYEPDNGGSCVYDYVLVTEGDETRGRFCGKAWYDWDAPTPNKKFFSKGRQVHLVFVSDFSNEDISPTGFEAYYTEIDNDECDEMNYKSKNTDEDWDELVVCDHFCHNFAGSYDCSCRIGYRLHSNQHTCLAIADCVDQELTADEGIIESPDYPNPYAKLSHCAWNIRVRDGFNVHLTFNSEFEVEVHDDKEDHNGCVYDILEISYNDEKETYCGTTAPQNGTVWDMNTTNVKIDFKTDLSVETKGFRIFYNTSRVRCLDSLNDPTNGEIVTSYQKGYYEFEDVVGHRCNRGYDLIGESRLECLSDGNWNNSQPTCRIKYCGRPDHLISVENSHIVDLDPKQEQFEYMENITVDCNDWYELKAGSPTWVCEDSKKWVNRSIPRAPNPPHHYPRCGPICGIKTQRRRNAQALMVSPDGANTAREHEYPWAVFLNFGDVPNLETPSYLCGGNLISSKYVLTAAHCLAVHGDPNEVRSPEQTHVWIGAHDRTDDPSTVTYARAENNTLHPNYTQNSKDCDIGLIRLNHTITMDNKIRPICLPSSADEFNSIFLPGAEGKVAAWGLFDDTSRASHILLQGEFPVVGQTECWNSLVTKSREIEKVLNVETRLTSNMFCAGYEDDNFSTCRGDSGSAFMMQGDSKVYAAGLVSFALDVNCGRAITYTVYSRLNKVLVDWIMDETNGLE